MRSAVELARAAGHCLGVRRAVEKVERLAALPRTGRLVSLGPLIHNRAEVERLRSVGLLPVGDASELQDSDEVVIRTHGATPAELRDLRGRVTATHDLTCPYVRSLQTLARRLARAGYAVILVGDESHPEVSAVLAWAREAIPAGRDETAIATAVSSAVDLDHALLHGRRVAVLAQTTQTPERLRALAASCLDRIDTIRPGARASIGSRARRGLVELRTFDTICPSTRERQAEALRLAAEVELMLIVGDRQSGNTRRLEDLCRVVQPRTALVQDRSEIDRGWLRGVRRVGVAGGASTSLSTLDDVVGWLRNLEHE